LCSEGNKITFCLFLTSPRSEDSLRFDPLSVQSSLKTMAIIVIGTFAWNILSRGWLLTVGVLLTWSANVEGNTGRVIGTERVLKDITEFTFLVEVFHVEHYLGGGSLINKDTVLTAASAVHSSKAEMLNLILGMTPISTKNFKKVSRMIIHPDYKEKSSRADIALLKLKEEATLDKLVGVIALANAPLAKAPCITAGTETMEDKVVFRVGTLNLMDDIACTNWLVALHEMKEGLFCVDGTLHPLLKIGQGTPIVSHGLQTGIVSKTMLEKDVLYAVVTNVSTYQLWIKFADRLPTEQKSSGVSDKFDKSKNKHPIKTGAPPPPCHSSSTPLPGRIFRRPFFLVLLLFYVFYCPTVIYQL